MTRPHTHGGPERFVRATTGSCLYHCRSATLPHPLRNARGTMGWVYACPGGTVSTVVFLGVGRRPSPARVRQYLQSRLALPERVGLGDLRAATRHGAELGRSAERWTRGPGTGRAFHLLYWRRYPRKAGRRYSYLYACFRHGTGDARFYAASNPPRTGACPFCRGESEGRPRR